MPDVKYVITVDSAGFVKGMETLDAAFKKLQESGKETTGLWGQVGQAFKSLAGQFTVATLAANVINGAVRALKGAVSDAFSGAIKEEESQHRLNTALEMTGRTRRGILPGMMKFAESQMDVTTYTHEEIEAVMTLLAQLTRLDGEGIQRAAKGAMGLASVLGMDLQSAALMVTKAMEGNYQALARVGIKVDENLPKEERSAAVLEKLVGLYPRATAELETMGGNLKNAKNAIGELTTEIGKQLLEDSDFAAVLKDITKILRDVRKGLVDTNDELTYAAVKTAVAKFAFRGMRDEVGPLTSAFNLLKNEVKYIPINMEAMVSAYLKGKGPFEAYLALVRGAADIIERGAKPAITATGDMAAAFKELGVASEVELRAKLSLAIKTLSDYRATGGSVPAVIDGLTKKIEELTLAFTELNPPLSASQAALAEELRFLRMFGPVATEAEAALSKLRKGIPTAANFGIFNFNIDTTAPAKSLLTLEERLYGVGLAAVIASKDVNQELIDAFAAIRQKAGDAANGLGLILRVDLENDLRKKEEQLRRFGGEMPYEEVKKLKEEIAQFKRELAQGTSWDKFADGAKKAMSSITKFTDAAFSGMDAIVAQSQKNKEIAIENEYKKRLAYINANVKDEDARQKAVMALEAEFQIKKTAAQAAGAKQQKAIALAAAIMNTAEAISAALTMKPWTPFNFALAAMAGAMGAIQVALIAKQPIPLAKGAVFSKPTLLPAVTYQVGDAGPGNPEIIAPKSTIRDAVREAMGSMLPQMAFAGAGAGGGQTITIHGPLITTTGLSRRDIHAAGEMLVDEIRTQLGSRSGRKL
jgi:hypothetical protein